MPDAVLTGRHVKRGADERAKDDLQDHYPERPYVGLHQDTDESRQKRRLRMFVLAVREQRARRAES